MNKIWIELFGANLLLAKNENSKLKLGSSKDLTVVFCWDGGEKQTYGWVAKYSREDKEFFFVVLSENLRVVI